MPRSGGREPREDRFRETKGYDSTIQNHPVPEAGA